METASVRHRSLMISRADVLRAACVLACLWAAAGTALAQTTVLPLGDLITHGGQEHVSYRYDLWQQLQAAGHDVDFVGRQQTIFGEGLNPFWYPTTDRFDRDHEGYWGWRTDQIADIVIDAATINPGDVVLIYLGTNDIGQMGPAGVTNADFFLRLIIEQIRSVTPDVTFLLAQVAHRTPERPTTRTPTRLRH